MKRATSIAVLGAGSWGTALALVLARKGHRVNLWGRDVTQISDMLHARCNKRYLPGVPLPESIVPTHDLKQALTDVADILIVVPSHAFVSLLEQLQPLLNNKVTQLAWASKGLQANQQLLDGAVQDLLPNISARAVLSGPSFAKEVAADLPTAITVAATDQAYAEHWSQRLHQPRFRVYLTQDMIGVQLCGAVKNVLAIVTGISDGLALGANARAALITRGLAEMRRLGLALGAQQETFMGLAGLGDVVLTCTDDQSRNRRFGKALGEGLSQQQALERVGQVVEGRHNVRQVYALAEQHQLDMPICRQIYAVLCQDKSVSVAITELLERTAKASEF